VLDDDLRLQVVGVHPADPRGKLVFEAASHHLVADCHLGIDERVDFPNDREHDQLLRAELARLLGRRGQRFAPAALLIQIDRDQDAVVSRS
jgi:hypothetical protein